MDSLVFSRGGRRRLLEWKHIFGTRRSTPGTRRRACGTLAPVGFDCAMRGWNARLESTAAKSTARFDCAMRGWNKKKLSLFATPSAVSTALCGVGTASRRSEPLPPPTVSTALCGVGTPLPERVPQLRYAFRLRYAGLERRGVDSTPLKTTGFDCAMRGWNCYLPLPVVFIAGVYPLSSYWSATHKICDFESS